SAGRSGGDRSLCNPLRASDAAAPPDDLVARPARTTRTCPWQRLLGHVERTASGLGIQSSRQGGQPIPPGGTRVPTGTGGDCAYPPVCGVGCFPQDRPRRGHATALLQLLVAGAVHVLLCGRG